VATAKAEAGTELTIGLAGHNWLFGYQNPEVVRSGAGSEERVQASDIVLEHDATDWFRATYEWVRTAAATTRTNTTRERLTGFTSDTVLTDATITDPNGNAATVIITLDRAAKKLTAVTNTPQSTINIAGVTINGLPQSLNTESISTPTYFYYDALGRPISEKDPLGFGSGRTYDSATGWVTATTNAAGKVTTYQYYQLTEANAGKLKCQTDPNGKKSYTQFNNRG
jgi:YD repeat-containing protein